MITKYQVTALVVIFCSLGIMWFFGGKSKKPSTTTPATTPSVFRTTGAKFKGLWHWIIDNFWKVFWGCFAIWLVTVIAGHFQNKPAPPPPKVFGPTEVLYTIEIRDEKNRLVNYKGDRKSRSDDWDFVVSMKGFGSFEGFLPLESTLRDPHGDKVLFIHNFGGRFGTWSCIRNEEEVIGGKIQISHEEDGYVPNQIGTIRGLFWPKGKDPEKDRGFTLTLTPPKRITETRTVRYWQGGGM